MRALLRPPSPTRGTLPPGVAVDASPPGLAEIMRQFAWDVPWLAAFVLAGFAYALGTHRARARGTAHPAWRVVAFYAGLAAAYIAVLSPLEHYGNQVLWINFAGFLVLTMMAAPLLVLSAPLTLAFRASSPPWRKRLRSLYRSRPVAFLTFPVASGLIFAAVTYTWQFSSLTDRAAENAFVRDAQLASLLFVSLAFWTPAICADPVRWRMPYPLRALYIMVEMAHKALFGGMFLAASRPFHSGFATRLPAWAPDPMSDQRAAIVVLWLSGNFIFLAVLAGLVHRWLQYEGRNQHRVDRRLELARAAERRRRAALDQVFQKPL